MVWKGVPMKKLLFIVNPRAGKTKSRAPLFDAVAQFSRAGYLVRVYITEAGGQARDITARWGGQYDMVVCAGGDGTLNETLSGLMQLEQRPLLGYLPCGSTNDFAASLHLPTAMDEAARAAVCGAPYPLDVGRHNDRYFAYVASFGAFTRSSYSATQAAKNALGHFAYILQGVKDLDSLRPYSCRVQAEAILSGQSALLAQSGQLSEAIAAHKAELAAIDANREGALRRAADLRTLAAELSGDRSQKEAALAQYQRQIEAAQTEIGQRRAEQAQLKAQSAVISERLAGISQEKIALEAERTTKSRAGQEMNETLLNLERAASRLETKLTTSAMEEKQILDKLWETYELNHSDAQAQRNILSNPFKWFEDMQMLHGWNMWEKNTSRETFCSTHSVIMRI